MGDSKSTLPINRKRKVQVMRKELRKVIALRLLVWSIQVMPTCKLKEELLKAIVTNVMDGMETDLKNKL